MYIYVTNDGVNCLNLCMYTHQFFLIHHIIYAGSVNLRKNMAFMPEIKKNMDKKIVTCLPSKFNKVANIHLNVCKPVINI